MEAYYQFNHLKPITFTASKSDLWRRPSRGRRVLVKLHSMLPSFKLSPGVLRSLWTRRHPDVLRGSKYSPSHFLRLNIDNSSGEYSIKVKCPGSQSEFELVYQSIVQKIEDYENREILEPLDLCKALLSYTSAQTRLQIHSSLVFPAVTLQYQQLPPMSIVSTPLTVQLTSRQVKSFQTGYLTMDQKKRLLPLVVNDPAAFKYPLVGVWASCVPNEHKDFPFTHPLIWAACVRYLTSSLISKRASASPENYAFLLVYFSEKPLVYEVSTESEPSWAVASTQCNSRINESETICFLRQRKKTLKSTTSDGKVSTRESWSRMSPSALKRIGDQDRALKDLQMKIKHLQKQLPSQENLTRSCEIRGISERTINVPKIVYESQSDSSEDEEIAKVQQKYLNLPY